jgi:hypothetical protein
MKKNDRCDRANKGLKVGLCILLVTLLGGCGGTSVDEPQALEIESQALSNLCTTVLCQTGTVCNPKTGSCEPSSRGIRCTISGDPPVTTGCADRNACVPLSCTNSMPPTCFGTCALASLGAPSPASAAKRTENVVLPPVGSTCETVLCSEGSICIDTEDGPVCGLNPNGPGDG